MRSFFLIFLLFIAVLAGPIVETKYGRIEGITHGNSEVFLAIPFAKPPVGALRFERPEEPEPWEDVYQATQFRNDCTPHYRLVATFSSWSGEDCLTLNIVKPKKAEKLPVLVWVHGGGYAFGSASQHDFKVFAEKYNERGVIVASIQYRLGFMGFFTDGTENAKGNMGLFDQALALKFIKENIERFGGDSDRITIWGYSAGAASVSQLTLSPYSRDLYNNAIIMSASSLSGWATGSTVPHHSRILAEEVGCDFNNNPKECLKNKTVDELFDVVDKLGPTTGNIDIMKWSPVIDGDFFPKHPEELIKEAPKKPTIIGMSDKEGAYFTIGNQGRVLADFCLSPEEVKKVDDAYVRNIIDKKLLYDDRYGNDREKVSKRIGNFYLNRGRPETDVEHFILDRYSDLFSDIVFNVPIVREIQRRVEQNTPVYTYLFEHYHDDVWKDHIPEVARGSPHANEYHYLFELPVMRKKLKFEEGTEEHAVQEDLINLVTSFAKTGRPNVRDIDWRPVSDPDDINYLSMDGGDVSIRHGLFEAPTRFWNELKNNEGFDLIDPTSPSTRNVKEEL